MPKTLLKLKPENAKNPPMAKVLEEYVSEKDPWKQLRSRPGIKILSTAGRTLAGTLSGIFYGFFLHLDNPDWRKNQ